jgi:hypothetical protein
VLSSYNLQEIAWDSYFKYVVEKYIVKIKWVPVSRI